jgi:hypothetical protein
VIYNEGEGKLEVASKAYSKGGAAAGGINFNNTYTPPQAVLERIEVTTLPVKTVYNVYDLLDLTGMAVTAFYSDGTSKPATGYTTAPANGTPLNNGGEQEVKVEYTEGGKTVDTTFKILVELKYLFTYSVPGGNGTLEATVKGTETPVPSGTIVYLGTQIILKSAPDNGFCVKEWTNNGVAVNGTAEDYEIEVRDTTRITVEFKPASDYNFGIYVDSDKDIQRVGDTFYVNVMLHGDRNYTQMAAEILYDHNVLEYGGYTDLMGWAASVSKPASDKVAVRSVPSMNMVVGAPCSPAIRIVRLAFTVKGGFEGDTTETILSFASTLVSPAGGVVGSTIDPGQPISIALQK